MKVFCGNDGKKTPNLLSFIFYSVPILVICAYLFAPYCGLCPSCNSSAKKRLENEEVLSKMASCCFITLE